VSYVISYPGGAYGNFVGFTLRWMLGEYPVDYRPFTSQGNSHNWDDKFWDVKKYGLEGLKPMLNEDTFNILHPKWEENHNLISQLELLTNYYNKVLYILPSFEDCVWILNNRQTKIYSEGWIEHNRHTFIDLNAWESDKKEIWEMREFLSLFLYDQLLSETELPNVLDYQNYDSNKIKFVYMNELRDKFTITFKDLCNWLNLQISRTDSDIFQLEKDWKNHESFLYKDMLINDLVNAIIDNKNLSMENLTLVDEAMIQRQLRNKGFELQCYKLNKWPKTTSELRELIYEN